MWSIEAVSFEGFQPQPSLIASLEEFIKDLQQVAPFHSGFSAVVKKEEGEIYEIHLRLECGHYAIEETAKSTKLFEVLYFVFQSVYGQIIEQENTKVQALNTKDLGLPKGRYKVS